MKSSITTSDLSGQVIESETPATITVRVGQRNWILDVTDEEALEFAAKGRAFARRGRKPKRAERVDSV